MQRGLLILDKLPRLLRFDGFLSLCHGLPNLNSILESGFLASNLSTLNCDNQAEQVPTCSLNGDMVLQSPRKVYKAK